MQLNFLIHWRLRSLTWFNAEVFYHTLSDSFTWPHCLSEMIPPIELYRLSRELSKIFSTSKPDDIPRNTLNYYHILYYLTTLTHLTPWNIFHIPKYHQATFILPAIKVINHKTPILKLVNKRNINFFLKILKPQSWKILKPHSWNSSSVLV